MTQDDQKALRSLSSRLRVLKSAEKHKYIYHLDRYARDFQIRDPQARETGAFFPYRLASRMYFSLEGFPYTQPEFPSQQTFLDIRERDKFNALYAGIVAYAKASEAERNSFKKNTLEKIPNPVSKIVHLFKMRWYGMD